MQFSIRVYNIYILPVLLFVAQLEELPKDFDNLEKKACSLLFKGPTAWIAPHVLRSIRRSLGFAAEIKCARTASRAAKLRIYHIEAREGGGLDVEGKYSRLQAAKAASEAGTLQSLTTVIWRSWFEYGVVPTLHKNNASCGARGVSAKEVIQCITKEIFEDDEINDFNVRSVKKSFQATASKRLLPPPMSMLAYLEKRLKGWDTGVFPRAMAQRAERNLKRVSHLVPPKVVAAMLRSWFDGWCTQRRFSNSGSSCKCIWGCRCNKSDSLAHYTCCPVLADWGLKFLKISRKDSQEERRKESLLLHSELQASDDVLFAAAVKNYAMYTVHNLCRHQPRRSATKALNALDVAAIEAVAGEQDAIRRLHRLKNGRYLSHQTRSYTDGNKAVRLNPMSKRVGGLTG